MSDTHSHTVRPHYETMHDWEVYASNLMIELDQSLDEGLDVEHYRPLFTAVAELPLDETKVRLGEVLADVIASAPTRSDYPYREPSDLEGIRALRKRVPTSSTYDPDALPARIHGAWMGRICGCMLGKTVEGIRTNELIPFLKETDNYPMHRYIYRTDVTDETLAKYGFPFAESPYADGIDGMPTDDDTNFVALAQVLDETCGRDFTTADVGRTWMALQGKDAYCTAERVAYCNLVRGFVPPDTAVYRNPYREWIGAQIRGDYFGYINPGDPEAAAEMAWRDASLSHVKNGIYGEMFVAAMLAVAATADATDIEGVILGGLGEIPHTSRLYEDVMRIVTAHREGVSQEEAFALIHERYDEYTAHGWCHIISNAMIVAAALLYGEGDYGRSVCMAVETGFDTDCNGATVGSVLGMLLGIDGIPADWKAPMRDTLHTTVFGVGTVRISDCAARTLKHLR